MRKIAMVVIICFIMTFIVAPVAVDARVRRNRDYNYYGYNYGTTETYGNGGKWEEKNSSKSNGMWPIVVGTVAVLTIGGLIWLGNKVLNMKKQERAYQPSPPTYHPDKWPRGIEPPEQNNLPAWQDQNRQVPATYNVADPF